MELESEEAKKICERFINENKRRPIILHDAIKTVLKESENKEMDIEKWKEIHDEDEEKIRELNNKICHLEFELENSISKKKIEEYLAEETEKYKVYKKEVDKNENLRGQLWHHMGAKNMCEKILGIEKKVILD